MLSSTKTLLYDSFAHAFGLRCSFLRLLNKTTHSFACKTNRMSRWSPPIHWNNHVCLISQRFKPEHSLQAKNLFLLYGSTRVTCRNNDFDDWHFVSQNCFRCQYHCIPLCVQRVTEYAKQKKPLECEFWHILSAYFTTLMNSESFKNGIMGLYTTQAKYLHIKVALNYSCMASTSC